MKNLAASGAVVALVEIVVNLVIIAHKLEAHNNMFYSEIICGSLLRGIHRADQDEIGTYLTVITSVLKINDDFKTLRIEWLLGVTQM